MMDEKNIISFGAGQNSTAMIIWMFKNNIKIDDIIFADVGNEEPETYIWLPEFKKWCNKNNLKFTEKNFKNRDIYEKQKSNYTVHEIFKSSRNRSRCFHPGKE